MYNGPVQKHIRGAELVSEADYGWLVAQGRRVAQYCLESVDRSGFGSYYKKKLLQMPNGYYAVMAVSVIHNIKNTGNPYVRMVCDIVPRKPEEKEEEFIFLECNMFLFITDDYTTGDDPFANVLTIAPRSKSWEVFEVPNDFDLDPLYAYFYDSQRWCGDDYDLVVFCHRYHGPIGANGVTYRHTDDGIPDCAGVGPYFPRSNIVIGTKYKTGATCYLMAYDLSDDSDAKKELGIIPTSYTVPMSWNMDGDEAQTGVSGKIIHIKLRNTSSFGQITADIWTETFTSDVVDVDESDSWDNNVDPDNLVLTDEQTQFVPYIPPCDVLLGEPGFEVVVSRSWSGEGDATGGSSANTEESASGGLWDAAYHGNELIKVTLDFGETYVHESSWTHKNWTREWYREICGPIVHVGCAHLLNFYPEEWTTTVGALSNTGTSVTTTWFNYNGMPAALGEYLNEYEAQTLTYSTERAQCQTGWYQLDCPHYWVEDFTDCETICSPTASVDMNIKKMWIADYIIEADLLAGTIWEKKPANWPWQGDCNDEIAPSLEYNATAEDVVLYVDGAIRWRQAGYSYIGLLSYTWNASNSALFTIELQALDFSFEYKAFAYWGSQQELTEVTDLIGGQRFIEEAIVGGFAPLSGIDCVT